MKIHVAVHASDGSSARSYSYEAASWNVKDGYLWLNNESHAPVACFAPGFWVSVAGDSETEELLTAVIR